MDGQKKRNKKKCVVENCENHGGTYDPNINIFKYKNFAISRNPL